MRAVIDIISIIMAAGIGFAGGYLLRKAQEMPDSEEDTQDVEYGEDEENE